MGFSKHHRTRVAERMDADDVDAGELSDALRFIRRVNRLLRYNAASVRAVGRLTAGRPMTVLDVATGSGDLLADLPPTHRKVGLDRHATTLLAARLHVGPTVALVRGDALALPCADRSVDVVTCGMFLHHLSDADATAALREMARVARVGVVVADLLRRRRAYAWITLLTMFSRPMVRHDARASVAHAFTLAEARRLADDAGLDGATIAATFGHRFLLTWRRPATTT